MNMNHFPQIIGNRDPFEGKAFFRLKWEIKVDSDADKHRFTRIYNNTLTDQYFAVNAAVAGERLVCVISPFPKELMPNVKDWSLRGLLEVKRIEKADEEKNQKKDVNKHD